MCLPALTRPQVAMETATAGAQGQVTAANTRRAISIHKTPGLVSINHPGLLLCPLAEAHLNIQQQLFPQHHVSTARF